jgi:hypothetical protein
MILKPGRDFGEVQSLFGLLRLVLGLLLVTFTALLIRTPSSAGIFKATALAGGGLIRDEAAWTEN